MEKLKCIRFEGKKENEIDEKQSGISALSHFTLTLF
jgi:hypothetical protein